MQITEFSCVVFAPDEYEHIYGKMINKNQNEEIDDIEEEFTKLLHKVLADTTEIINFVNDISEA